MTYAANEHIDSLIAEIKRTAQIQEQLLQELEKTVRLMPRGNGIASDDYAENKYKRAVSRAGRG